MKNYKIKPFYGSKQQSDMIELDKKRRANIEKKCGPMTDAAWKKYKELNRNNSK